MGNPSDEKCDNEQLSTATAKESSDTASDAKIEQSNSKAIETLMSNPPSIQKKVLSTADRSKALAQSRFLLQETVSSLTEFCSMDTRREQKFHGVQIENSRSQKIWKPLDIASISSNSSASVGRKSFG